MIRITWNNLTPPGYQSEDIVNYLLKPAIFDNPELQSLKKSVFFEQLDDKGRSRNFCDDLLENKTKRTRLFSLTSESRAITKRMLNLLLEKTKEENIPYNMNSFPIRHEFKRQWMKILTPVEKLTAEEFEHLEINKNGLGFLDGRVILPQSDVLLYQEYINAILKETVNHKELEALDQALDNSLSGSFNKRTNRDFENVDVKLCYKNNKVALSSLIMSIPPCTYSSASYYKDDEESALLSTEENLFFERLATLSVIASVWYIWENVSGNTTYQEQLLRISDMIFPSDALSVFHPSAPASNQEDENSDTQMADRELQKVQSLLSAQDFNAAGVLCEKIFLYYKNASDTIIASTLGYLIQCCENGYTIPGYFASINNIIREAFSYGSSYLAKDKDIIKNHPRPSEVNSEGVYTINCGPEDKVCDWIIHTAPSSWQKTIYDLPESALAPNTNQRILLVREDYSRNLSDAINILDKIKSSIDRNETKISDWEHLELYIRCDENEITPLLDTTLSYFTENTEIAAQSGLSLIKIYLIDEAKRSAEFLFAQHPHFYPLTLARNINNDSKCIHIVLATDNKNLKYPEWLIKEAFWTLPRADSSIDTKISIISPYAAELCHSITAQCPGLASISLLNGKVENPDSFDLKAGIPDINFPVIEYIDTSFSSQALQIELEKLWNPSDFFYYIVDSSSDIEGVNLAIRIREHSIRQSVLTGHSSNYSKYNATIAVRCFDPDIAGLTKELIVPKEKDEHGKKWFNNYNLIPFGSKESLYSWDQLSGGIIETISQCIHLQYCNAPHDHKSCISGLNSYFRRLYNHDSSFGAAVSMPYRLYEAGIIPDNWVIQKSDAWWNEKIREKLSSEYKRTIVSDKKEIETLARYEHMRWCCFQLTRGWLPVEPYRVVQFMSSGARRHVLQIAKLHPCLCSWDGLVDLQRELSLYAGRKVNQSARSFDSLEEIAPYLDKKFISYYSLNEDYSLFRKIDYKNIEETDSIINTAWDIEGVREESLEHQ